MNRLPMQVPSVSIVATVEGEVRFPEMCDGCGRCATLTVEEGESPNFTVIADEEVRIEVFDTRDNRFRAVEETILPTIPARLFGEEFFDAETGIGEFSVSVYRARREITAQEEQLLQQLFKAESLLAAATGKSQPALNQLMEEQAMEFWERFEDGEPVIYHVTWGAQAALTAQRQRKEDLFFSFFSSMGLFALVEAGEREGKENFSEFSSESFVGFPGDDLRSGWGPLEGFREIPEKNNFKPTLEQLEQISKYSK